MALQFQNVPLVFNGLNNKIDVRKGLQGQWTTLQNCWMDKTGRLQKRYGYTVSEFGSDNNFFATNDVTAIAEWKGSLVAFSGSLSNVAETNYYVSKNGIAPDRRGTYWAGKLEFYRAKSNVGTLSYCQHCESNDYKFIFESGVITQCTKELAPLREYSQAELGITVTLTGSAVMLGTPTGFYFVNGPVLKDYNWYKFDVVDGALTLSDSGSVGVTTTSNKWDIVLRLESGITYFYIITDEDTVGTRVTKYRPDNDTSITQNVSVTTGTHFAIDVHSDFVFYAFNDASNDVRAGVLNVGDLSVKTALAALLSSPGAGNWEWLACSGVVFSDGSASPSVWASGDNVFEMRCRRGDNTATENSSATTLFGAQIISRGYSINALGTRKYNETDVYALNEAVCWIKVKPDPNFDANIVAMCVDAGTDDISFSKIKSHAHCLNGRAMHFDDNDYPFSEKLTFPITEITNGYMVADIVDNSKSRSYEYARLLMADVGPNVGFYDGKLYTNAGFAYIPSFTGSVPAVAGGLTGTFSYVVIATYKDAQGNIHRSAPSLPQTFTVSSETVSLSINYYAGMWANRDGRIEIYRSEDGGIYRKLLTNVTLEFANPVGTTDTGSFELGENLYTTGGILEHIAPPAARSTWVSKDRAWIISAEEPLQVYFSKRLVPFEGPNFTDAFVLQVEDQGGELFAGASLDDKSVLFKRTAIYIIFGDGPDELGNGEYVAQQISYDTGTTNPRSVVESNQGIWFASKKGIYLLTKDLQTQFVGAPVDDYDESLITDSIVIEDRNQVWFFRSNGETLVFDTYHGQWCTFTPQLATGATIVDGTVRYVVPGASTASFYTESTSTFQDGTTNYDVVLQSNWIQLAGVQGYQRTRKIMIAGEVTGAYDYSLAMSYDLGDATTSETFSASSTTENKWEFKPNVQKTEAFRMQLTLSGGNRGLDVQNINLEIGSKGGTSRIPSANRKVGV